MELQGGGLKTVKIGEEHKLQQKLKDHMRSRGEDVEEAAKLGGGQTDLVFKHHLVIENKVYSDETDDPLDVALNTYGWQARQYSIAISEEIFAVVVGYKPKSNAGMKIGAESIRVRRLPGSDAIEIRLAVPIDYGDPSTAGNPPKRSRS